MSHPEVASYSSKYKLFIIIKTCFQEYKHMHALDENYDFMGVWKHDHYASRAKVSTTKCMPASCQILALLDKDCHVILSYMASY